MNVRAAAALILQQVIYQGTSLTEALVAKPATEVAVSERALLRDFCFGSLRWHERLSAILSQLVTKPLKAVDKDVECLLRIGLYQLLYQQTPAHAAVNETVKAVKALRKVWAEKLVNGVLRSFQRQQAELIAKVEQNAIAQWSYPSWLLKQIQQDWPQDWQAMVQASNTHAPMTLRVNQRHITTSAYQQLLAEAGISAMPVAHVPTALTLQKAVGVEQLPGFTQGWVSVQDAAAQLAAELLDCQTGMRVLDACAAPGGKTGHVLERTAEIQLLAVDNSAARLERVTQNLQRLQLSAQCLVADVGDTATWWDGQLFERILLDAPCSATGVIRRHPDIKVLRRASDIPALMQTQARLLQNLWPLLKPGGKLVYVTCSILPSENVQQIASFMTQQQNAMHQPLEDNWGHALSYGRQILPGEAGMDGFYYAVLTKALREE